MKLNICRHTRVCPTVTTRHYVGDRNETNWNFTQQYKTTILFGSKRWMLCE